MKKTLKALALALLVAGAVQPASAQYRTGSLYEDLNDSETVRSMKEHVSFLSSAMLEGRLAGSPGEEEAAAYLEKALERSGADIISPSGGELFGIKQENGDTLTSRNVLAFIPGYDPQLKDHYIVIGARMDNLGKYTMTVNGEPRERIFYGANGNASGMAMLVELASMLSRGRLLLRRSVLLAGFGASQQSCAGSWYFLNRSFKDAANIDAMVCLDMLGSGGDGFYAYAASNGDLTATLQAVNSTLQPVKPSVVTMEPVPSDHRAFYDSEIPSVLFTSGMYPEYNTDKDVASILDYDKMELELEYLYNYCVSLANGPRPIFNPSAELARGGEGNTGVIPYYDCDYKPTFLGSSDPRVFLEKWVYQYLKYPAAAVENGIQGKVLVDFIIDEKGQVQDVKVLRGAHELLDAEAVRVIKASPRWRAGYVQGKKVKSEISLYVEFRLEKKKSR